MVKVVIVEDDKTTQLQIKNVIRESNLAKEDLKTEYFTKFTSELKSIIKDNSERKLYIMDIELEGKISGIEIAKFIRENDWESEIIFITSHDKMFETAYRNVFEVFDFIEKFYHMESRLKKDLNIIYKKNFDNKMFKFSSRNIDLQIFYRSILYLYRDKEARKLVVCTDKNDYSINLNVTDATEYLDNRFLMVHRACIVNTDRVEAYNWSKGYFTLDNGKKVYMLARKYKKEVEDLYARNS
jgi:two-component system response regulator AgrA